MGQAISYGEFGQQLMFGFVSLPNLYVVPLDPRIGSFEVVQIKADVTDAQYLVTQTTLEVDDINETDNEGALNLAAKLGDYTQLNGLYNLRDVNNVEMKGTLGDINFAFIRMNFKPCLQSVDPSCASEEELRAWLKGHIFGIYVATNFIEMSEILPIEETLQTAINLILTAKIDLDQSQSKMLLLDEYRAELLDDNINLMGLTEPKQLNYLVYSDIVSDYPVIDTYPFQASIFLSEKVVMQKRVVLDIFMMFGEVGGLNDFSSIIVSPFFSFIAIRFLNASMVEKLFRGKIVGNSKIHTHMAPETQVTKFFSSVKFSTAFILAQICNVNGCCKSSKEDNRHRKALYLGISRVEQSLDVVKLIRQSRALSILLRLQLTRDERRLIRL